VDIAIPLAIAGSFCTATSSMCQRRGARSTEATRVDVWLIFRLARRPIWLAGLASQILGFAFQVTALRYGALALVQPVFALELLLVFAYMTALGGGRVTRRDWLAAAAMSAGLGVLLLAASPSGGRPHAPASLWWLAGLITLAAVLAGLAIAFGLRRRSPASARRRAAVLGAVTGIAWGFVAAVIKEFSSHLGQGPGPLVANWSLYVVIGGGAASLLLASHALAAGPLAASQPGFTILDPLTAGLLGLFLFGEHIQTAPLNLAAEAFALTLLAAGATTLSHSHLLAPDDDRNSPLNPYDKRPSPTLSKLSDPKPDRSPAPSTPIGAVADAADRIQSRSPAPSTGSYVHYPGSRRAASLRDAGQPEQGGDARCGEHDDRERGAASRQEAGHEHTRRARPAREVVAVHQRRRRRQGDQQHGGRIGEQQRGGGRKRYPVPAERADQAERVGNDGQGDDGEQWHQRSPVSDQCSRRCGSRSGDGPAGAPRAPSSGGAGASRWPGRPGRRAPAGRPAAPA
jgi:drug/metabolite transporter (DMT)-like permease